MGPGLSGAVGYLATAFTSGLSPAPLGIQGKNPRQLSVGGRQPGSFWIHQENLSQRSVGRGQPCVILDSSPARFLTPPIAANKLRKRARSSAAEQPAHNRRVAGSTPAGPTKFVSGDPTRLELLRSYPSPLTLALNPEAVVSQEAGMASWDTQRYDVGATIYPVRHARPNGLMGCPLQRMQSAHKTRIQAGPGLGMQIT